MGENSINRKSSRLMSCATDLQNVIGIDGKIEALPSIEGFLFKRTKGVFKRWVSRYFVLEDLELCYYYEQNKLKMRGSLDLKMVFVDVQLKPPEIKLVTSDERNNIRLKASSEEKAVRWAKYLQIHISLSSGPYVFIPDKRIFCKFKRIHYKDLMKTMKTGDLILFKGNSFMTRLQRVVSKSEYDHVAVVIKSSPKNVAFLDSTNQNGVDIVGFKDFVYTQPQNNFSKIIYRRVEFEMNSEDLRKVDDFIFKVLGKKFRLSAGKLFARAQDKEPEEKKGFFCSELVAMLYKTIGLLPERKPASRYWPDDFSDGKRLKLLKGAYLCPGLKIEIN